MRQRSWKEVLVNYVVLFFPVYDGRVMGDAGKRRGGFPPFRDSAHVV